MLFQPNSRYFSVETATLETPDGKSIRYLRRRILPSLNRFRLIQEYEVTEGERLDNITAHFLSDPEQFWRLCDANPILNPETLAEIGRHIRITLPEGIPGVSNV